MSSSRNHLDTDQHMKLLNPEEVSGNNFEQVTISAVKSPSPNTCPYTNKPTPSSPKTRLTR